MASNRIKGITIEIGGDTTKLDKALAGTDKALKSTQASLKDVDRLLKLDPGNTELLAQKQRLLATAMEETRQRADTLREAVANGDAALARGEAFQERYAPLLQSLDEAAKAYERLRDQKEEMDRQMELGEISTEQYDRWNDRLRESQAELRELKQQVADARAEMGGPMIDQSQYDAMQRELIETELQLRDLEEAAEDAGDSLEDTEGPADGLAGGLSGLAGVAAGAAMSIGEKLVDAAIEAAKWVWSLDEATEEYRVAMGKLNTAYDAAGFNAETAKKAYQGFYEILGDTDTATEASQLLGNMYNREAALSYMTEVLSKEYSDFASVIPIDAIIQAATETARTGEVTDSLVEILQEAGLSVYSFNKNLEEVSSERAKEATEALTKTLQDAGFNAEIVERNIKEIGPEESVGIKSLNTVFQALAKTMFNNSDVAEDVAAAFVRLSKNSEELSRWTDIAAGVYGTFGDSLPIEGLIEAVNETAKVGQVTGALADALNWVGISEDEFNELLQLTAIESDRATLIMNTLSGAYRDAAEAFRENNQVLLESRDAQMQVDEIQAKLGETVANLKNKLLEAFGPVLVAAIDGVAWSLSCWIVVIDKIGEAIDWLGEKIQGVIGFFQDLFGVSQKASNIPVDTGGGNARTAGASRALRTASAESLPYLAQGTVTRPHSPFMAVIGDNPNEPEVVSPLSTIEQAVRNVVGSGGGQANTVRVTVNFTGSLAQVARLMQPQITAETGRLGPQLAN